MTSAMAVRAVNNLALQSLLAAYALDRPLSTSPAGENGNLPHQNTVGYWWRKTRRDAGHPTIRLHDLRHFFASGLIAAGCDVVTVQRALGHSSATVTLNTYAHLWPTAEGRTRAAADSLLTAVLRPTDEPVTNEPIV